MLTSLAILALATSPQLPCHECESGGSVIYVDASSTYVGSNQGSAWATAFVTLQAAINSAAAGDCIWVAAGRYLTDNAAPASRSRTITIDKTLTLMGGFKGDEHCLDERAGLFSDTRISGEINQPGRFDNAFRVLTIGGMSSLVVPVDAVVDGFNIQGAYNDSSEPEGGGIYCGLTTASLRLRNCIVRDNTAGKGGGLYALGTELDIVRCEFTKNRADTEGGAMWLKRCLSGLNPKTGPLVFNAVFKNNKARALSGASASAQGGAIFLTDFENARRVTFTNCLLYGNKATVGGAAYLAEADFATSFKPGLARFYNCTIANNTATGPGGLGAAVYLEDTVGVKSARAALVNTIVHGNSPPATALYDESIPDSDLTADYCIVDAGDNYLDCNPAPDCANSGGCTVWDCDPWLAADWTLLAGSSAIDTGDQDVFGPVGPAGSGAPVILDHFDLDGDGDRTELTPLDLAETPRVQGAEVDRGAFEAGSGLELVPFRVGPAR